MGITLKLCTKLNTFCIGIFWKLKIMKVTVIWRVIWYPGRYSSSFALFHVHHITRTLKPVCKNNRTLLLCRTCVEPDGTRAETTFCLSPTRRSPFKSAGESVQSTAGSQVVCISVSNAGYTMFRGRVRVLATHSIRQFPLHFPSRASPCATTFRTQYTYYVSEREHVNICCKCHVVASFNSSITLGFSFQLLHKMEWI